MWLSQQVPREQSFGVRMKQEAGDHERERCTGERPSAPSSAQLGLWLLVERAELLLHPPRDSDFAGEPLSLGAPAVSSRS